MTRRDERKSGRLVKKGGITWFRTPTENTTRYNFRFSLQFPVLHPRMQQPMGPPQSPRETRRSGRRSAPSTSASTSKSPDSEQPPRQKDTTSSRSGVSSNGSNGRNRRPKQEDFDDVVEDRKSVPAPSVASNASTQGASTGKGKRKGKEKDKQPPPEEMVDEAPSASVDEDDQPGTEEEEQGITRCVCGSSGESSISARIRTMFQPSLHNSQRMTLMRANLWSSVRAVKYGSTVYVWVTNPKIKFTTTITTANNASQTSTKNYSSTLSLVFCHSISLSLLQETISKEGTPRANSDSRSPSFTVPLPLPDRQATLQTEKHDEQ